MNSITTPAFTHEIQNPKKKKDVNLDLLWDTKDV